MNADELRIAQDNITEEIYEYGINKLHYEWDKIGAIADGVSDIDAYLKTSPKVMWVLKEAYDENDGGYSMPKDIKNKCDEEIAVIIREGRIATYRNIIYTMEGIRNNTTREEMEDYSKLCSHMRDIAYININKMPAKYGTRSNADMTELYLQWKSITLKQIALYEPDVIIFGNTFEYFQNDNAFENLTDIGRTDDGTAILYTRRNQILINAYHPSSFCYSQINSIVKAICNLFPQK